MDANAISKFLEKQKKPFEIHRSYIFGSFKADLYAYRRFNILGRDYLFVHTGNFTELTFARCEAFHEAARTHVNTFYKLPRAMRLIVPNVVSVFISPDGFSDEALRLAVSQVRDWKGGECHDVFFIDSAKNICYGPDVHSVRVDGRDYTFKKTDPTNRSLGLLHALMNG